MASIFINAHSFLHCNPSTRTEYSANTVISSCFLIVLLNMIKDQLALTKQELNLLNMIAIIRRLYCNLVCEV